MEAHTCHTQKNRYLCVVFLPLSYVIKKVIREQGDRGWEKAEEACDG